MTAHEMSVVAALIRELQALRGLLEALIEREKRREANGDEVRG